MSLRNEVLALYRRILRVARLWKSTEPTATNVERTYIKEEARRLFMSNKDVSDDDTIRLHIQEAEARVAIGLHYNNPYPRLSNLPQQILPPQGQPLKKGQKLALERSKPIYLKSYDDS